MFMYPISNHLHRSTQESCKNVTATPLHLTYFIAFDDEALEPDECTLEV